MTNDGDIAARNIVVFVRSLRASGFNVSPQTSQHLARAIEIVGLHSVVDVREAFKSVVVTRHSQIKRFDELFDQFFSGDLVLSVDSVIERIVRRTQTHGKSRIGVSASSGADGAEEPEDVYDVAGGSRGERCLLAAGQQLPRDAHLQLRRAVYARGRGLRGGQRCGM